VEPRGLSLAVAEHFGIGFEEQKGSLALPYWNDGRVDGIKYRSSSGFKYSEDKSVFTLYNVDGVRGKPVVVLGEGESDTHAIWSRLEHSGQDSGTTGATQGDSGRVGVGGTSGAVESERLWKLFALDLLFARKVFVCYDADDAGDRAFRMAQRELGDKVIRIRPTKGKDMTEHLLAGGTLEDIGLATENLHI
jgi:hypothetical protein